MAIIKQISSALREVKKTVTRSRGWAAARRKHIMSNPKCAACSGNRMLQVHHIMPFNEDPALELDLTNLITLCIYRDCHLEIGHGGNYKYYNPAVVEICKNLRTGLLDRKTAEKQSALVRKANDGDKAT